MGKDFFNSVKYLGIKICENHYWRQQISDLAIKLNRVNVVLSKLRHCFDRKTLKSIYNAIFELHLCHYSLVGAQNSNLVKILFVLQRKSLRINELYIFEIVMLIHLLYSENPTF